jgi:hypothetical protein
MKLVDEKIRLKPFIEFISLSLDCVELLLPFSYPIAHVDADVAISTSDSSFSAFSLALPLFHFFLDLSQLDPTLFHFSLCQLSAASASCPEVFVNQVRLSFRLLLRLVLFSSVLKHRQIELNRGESAMS